jgi:hypothetical protein
MSKLDINKFPGLKFQLDQVENVKALIDLLNQRKELIKENTNDLSNYEKNERLITLNKTDRELAKLHKFVIEEKQKIDKNIDYLSQLSKDCDTDYKEVEKEFLEVFSNEQGVIEWYNSVKNENDFIAKLNRFDKMRGAIKNQKESKEKKITPEVAYQLVMQLKEFFTPYFELSSPLKVV